MGRGGGSKHNLGWNLAGILKNLYRVNRERGSSSLGAGKEFSHLVLSSSGSGNVFNKYINEKAGKYSADSHQPWGFSFALSALDIPHPDLHPFARCCPERSPFLACLLSFFCLRN